MADPIPTKPPETSETQLRRRRTLVSQVLVTGLISVAYSTPLSAVEAATKHGVSIRSVALFIVYSLTVLRFFVGNVLHLESEELTRAGSERKWFWDLTFIVAECVVLIFLGDVTSLQRSSEYSLNFFYLLLGLYSLDVAWLLSVAGLHALAERSANLIRDPGNRVQNVLKDFMREKQQFYRGWFWMNAGLAIGLWLFGFLKDNSAALQTWKLWVLIAANVAVFVYDVYVLNYTMLEREFDRAATAP